MTKQKRRHGRLMIVSGARNASTNTAFLYGRHFSHALSISANPKWNHQRCKSCFPATGRPAGEQFNL